MKMRLFNPAGADAPGVEAEALVDTGALLLCLPAALASSLQLPVLEERIVRLADGSVARVPYVGPVRIQVENRGCFAGALVMGHEPLLGAVPMEDMDLVIVPATRQVMPNPEHPNMAQATVAALAA
jgi:clan AA aspartic protease